MVAVDWRQTRKTVFLRGAIFFFFYEFVDVGTMFSCALSRACASSRMLRSTACNLQHASLTPHRSMNFRRTLLPASLCTRAEGCLCSAGGPVKDADSVRAYVSGVGWAVHTPAHTLHPQEGKDERERENGREKKTDSSTSASRRGNFAPRIVSEIPPAFSILYLCLAV